MRTLTRCAASLLLVAGMVAPSVAPATDVDGPDDCARTPFDFGDAPEGVYAYPGVLGHFPTCSAPTPPGTPETACTPVSSPPGETGFVKHQHTAADPGFWLGCPQPGFAPMGIDDDADGKVNDTGGPTSACDAALPVDCVETAFGMSFGQDECYGSTDAGIVARISLTACSQATVAFNAFSCAPAQREVYLNVLVDMNQDGDWNDNFLCGTQCAYEWAVRNVLVTLPPGCSTHNTPPFLVGPIAGHAWMRVTLSADPVSNDFPWAGSATTAGQVLQNGETEDYPVDITAPAGACPQYEDWGDAPEGTPAYPGVTGHFPTCSAATAPGSPDVVCPPISTAPGPTGFVRHVTAVGDEFQVWLGCGVPPGPAGVDAETDGKFNSTGASTSACNPNQLVDCLESAYGMTFGQDECTGDGVDAGVSAPIVLTACTNGTIAFNTYNCAGPHDFFLNILVDMNQDGDWNDNFKCGAQCAYEWAVKNFPIPANPGCESHLSPAFLVGPNAGSGWVRITITQAPVADDFPWNGSAGASGNGFFVGGETEDYPAVIQPYDPCNQDYVDYGDAPEGIAAYTSGLVGHFPTCSAPTPAGDQTVGCSTPLSSPPGPTGFVRHVSSALVGGPRFGLGCSADGENDGKVSSEPAGGGISVCSANQPVDCIESTGPMLFGQDECYGDPEAALATYVQFGACSTATVPFRAFNCGTQSVAAYLNILVDWNADGDWNDMVPCSQFNTCAPEWAVKNVPVSLDPGCQNVLSPSFRVGPEQTDLWMRMTLTTEPVPNDFPWNGSVSMPNSEFVGGETEDYPVRVVASNVSVPSKSTPDGVEFASAVPNPAHDEVLLRWSLPREADVTLVVYDLTGRRVASLVSGRSAAGPHDLRWDFRDTSGQRVPVGFYVVKLRVGDHALSQRIMRVR